MYERTFGKIPASTEEKIKEEAQKRDERNKSDLGDSFVPSEATETNFVLNTFYDNETNRVLTLDPKVEQDIMDSIQKNEAGSYAALEPSYVSKLIANMKQIIDESIIGNQAPIILTSPIVRIYFKKLIEQTLPQVVVLSYNEVDTKVEIQSIGMVTVDEN